MVSSILQESRFPASAIEEELQALASPSKSTKQNLLILGVSLLLFVLAGSLSLSVTGLLVLVVVIAIHELGHVIAMKLFGYRDVQMFFIPLFGAAVSGGETSPSGAARAVVALSGPVPGIALGIVCTLMFHATGVPVLMEAARTFLLLNTFNLLPFVPLDGGRCIEAILFVRAPILRALSTAIAGLALAALTIAARDVVFGIVAYLVLRSVPHAYSSSKLAVGLKSELASSPDLDAPSIDRIPRPLLERLIPLLEQRLPENLQTPKGIAVAVRDVWSMVWFKPPSAIASIGLIVLYLGCFATGIMATLVAELSFRPPGEQFQSARTWPLSDDFEQPFDHGGQFFVRGAPEPPADSFGGQGSHLTGLHPRSLRKTRSS